MKRPYHVLIQNLGIACIACIVFDALDGQVWMQSVALLEDSGARDCMIDVAVCIVCLLEELEDVAVLGHISTKVADEPLS